MKIARITGHATGTIKDSQLAGQKWLIVDILDTSGKILESSVVVLDVCGAGLGEMVLVATGSAARLPPETSGVPTDATVVAIIEEITLGGDAVHSAKND